MVHAFLAIQHPGWMFECTGVISKRTATSGMPLPLVVGTNASAFVVKSTRLTVGKEPFFLGLDAGIHRSRGQVFFLGLQYTSQGRPVAPTAMPIRCTHLANLLMAFTIIRCRCHIKHRSFRGAARLH